MQSVNRVLLIGTLPRGRRGDPHRRGPGSPPVHGEDRPEVDGPGRRSARQATEWHDITYSGRRNEPSAETRRWRRGERETRRTVIDATTVRLLTGSQPSDD